MFRSGLFDKDLGSPENSSGRNNICNRYPIGITSLGEDNQNIRIQLAVHKYNSLANNSTLKKHSLVSPNRRSISINSTETKNYECKLDSTLKSENKNGNQYEGVGNFPMVHLEKSSVLYRPIKRIIRKGISYPEIPENRFLNHIHQLCSDSKHNTKSVLDVLQDLSKKRIHSKTDNHKKKSLGLGIDDIEKNCEMPHKPLFIKTDKTLPILMKDNTTQTMLPYCSDKSCTSQTSSNLIKKDASDPKAELRKKLAKQNNEIFASLSSSSLPIFSSKRKIDKISKNKNDSQCEILTLKKPKLLVKPKNDCEGNGILNMNDFETNTNLINKIKSGSATSPSANSKDRLTTIFLEMKSENSKNQIFKSSLMLTENKSSVENNEHNFKKSLAQRSAFNEETGEKPKDKITNKNLSDKQSMTLEPEKNQNLNLLIKTSHYSHTKSSSLTSSYVAPITISSSSLHNFFESSKSAPNFNISTSLNSSNEIPQNITINSQQTTTVLKNPDKSIKTDDAIDDSSSETSSIMISQKSGDANEKENVSKQFVFGKTSENEKNNTDLNTFRFGLCENSSTNNVSQPINDKTKFTFPMSTVTDKPLMSDSLNFSFDVKNNNSTMISINSLPAISTSNLLNSSNTMTTSLSSSKKLTFTCQKPKNYENSFEDSTKPTNEIENCRNNSLNSISTANSQNPSTPCLFGQNSEKSIFAFGTKPNVNEAKSLDNNDIYKADAIQTKTEDIQIQVPVSSQKNKNDTLKGSLESFQSTNKTTTTCNSSIATNQSKLIPQTAALVTFNEQNSENSLFCDSLNQKFNNPDFLNYAPDKSSNALPEQKKQSFSFNFTKNSETQCKENSLEENSQTTLFSFGQKPKEDSCKNNNYESSNVIQTSNFCQKSSNTLTESNLNSLVAFGQNSSLTGQKTEHFNQLHSPKTKNLDTTTTNSFVNKSVAVPFGSVFNQSPFSSKTPVFGTSDNKALSCNSFGISNNQPNTVFQISTTESSSTEFKPVATSASFGVSSVGFVSKSNNTFGITTSSTFGTSTTIQPTFTFGTSTTTRASNSFNTATTTLSTSTFGLSTSTNLNNIFGSSPKQLNIFGTSTTQPTSTFTSNTAKMTNSFGTTVTTTQNAGFGLTSSLPFGQPFVQNSIKISTTSEQASDVNIFGQNTSGTNTVSNAFNLPTSSSFNSSTINCIFGQKSNDELGSVFGQISKTQTSPFRQTSASPSFNVGLATSNVAASTSPPNTTTSVFTFGGSSQAHAFNFGNNFSTSSSSTSSPFIFNSSGNDTFKLGLSSPKEGSKFGGNNTSTFTFGAQLNSNIPATEATFSFGSGQATSTPAFNFTSHSASPVFSFGGSGSNTGSSSTFNFGTPQNTGSFGQPTSSPVATFSAPGTFSIGSGSSQSRQRASSRLRRRP